MSLPKTLQRRVEALVRGLGGGGGAGETTEGEKKGEAISISVALPLMKKLSPLCGVHIVAEGLREPPPPNEFPTFPRRLNSLSTKTQGSNSGLNPRGGRGQQHLEAANLLM